MSLVPPEKSWPSTTRNTGRFAGEGGRGLPPSAITPARQRVPKKGGPGHEETKDPAAEPRRPGGSKAAPPSGAFGKRLQAPPET